MRDRNEAFESLSSFIDLRDRLSNKEVQAISESLFGVVLNDKASYDKNSTDTTRARLERGVSLLRKCLTKDAKQLRYRVVKASIQFIRSNLFGLNRELCLPIALDLVRVLHELLLVDEHREHLSREEWIQTTCSVITATESVRNLTGSDKLLSELWNCLKCLIMVPVVMFDDISLDLVELLKGYFSQLKKETSPTSIALEVLNQTLILLSVSNVNRGFDLVKAVLKVAWRLNSTNFEALHCQLLIFGMLASRYITSDMVLLIDDKNNPVPVMDEESRENLILWLDALVLDAISSPDALTIDDFDISSIRSTVDKKSWFSLSGICLQDSADPKPWMKSLVLIHLLSAFYSIDTPQRNDVEPQWKKQRSAFDSYAPLLKYCDSTVGFLQSLLNHGSTSLQKIGLQLLAFQLSSFQVDHSLIPLKSVMFYETPYLASWTSLVIGLMAKCGWEVETADMHHLLRINLQLLKEDTTVSTACFAITEILKPPGTVITEKLTNQLVEVTFDVSEVYGPSKISDDAILFWMTIAHHARFLNSDSKVIGDLILKWLDAKWLTIFSKSDIHLLGSFITWLCGRKVTITTRWPYFDNVFGHFQSRTQQFSKLADQIMGSKVSSQSVSHDFQWISPPPLVTITRCDEVLQRLLQAVSECDEMDKKLHAPQLLSHAIFVYQHVFDISQFSATAEQLKYELSRQLDGLSLPTDLPIINALRYLELSESPATTFVAEHINVNELLTNDKDYSSSLTPEDIHGEFSDFAVIRREQKLPRIANFVYTDFWVCHSLEQSMVELIFKINSTLDDSIMGQLIRYLDTLSGFQFISALFTTVSMLHEGDITYIKSIHIIRILRQCGAKLLGLYEFERSHIAYVLLLDICSLFSEKIFTSEDRDLMLDFSDILNWFVSIGKKGSLYGDLELSRLGSLVYNILCFGNCADVIDPSNLREFGLMVLNQRSRMTYLESCTEYCRFVKTLPSSDRSAQVQQFLQCIHAPESASETAAIFTQCSINLGKVGYRPLVHVVDILNSYHSSFHFTKYLRSSVQQLLGNCYSLPTNLEIDLLCLWYDERQTLVDFPYFLYGYTSFEQFVLAKKCVIYSIVKTRKHQCKRTISLIIEISKFEDEDDLMLHSIPWITCLAFAKNGTGSQIIDELKQKFEDVVEFQNLIVLDLLFYMCDCSSEDSILKAINHTFQGKMDDAARVFLQESSPVLDSMIYGVPLSSALTLISRVPRDFWEAKNVYFLLKNLTSQLQKCIPCDSERVLIARKVVILGLFTELKAWTKTPLQSYLSVLIQFLSEECIHDYFAKLIVESLVLFRFEWTHDPGFANIILSLFENSAYFYDSHGHINQALKNFLLKFFVEYSAHNGAWKEILIVYVDILKDNEMTLTQQDFHSLLGKLADAPMMFTDKCLSRAMNLIFSKASHLNYVDDITCKREIAELLLKSDETHHSPCFSAFIGRYLGSFYLNTGDSLVGVKQDFQKGIEYDAEATCSSLLAITETCERIIAKTNNMEEKILLECFFSFIIHQGYQSLQSIEGLVTSSFFQHYSKFIVPLTTFLFEFSHMSDYERIDIKYLLSNPGTLPYTQWVQAYSLALIDSLLDQYPFLLPLRKYLKDYPSSCENFLVYLWLFYVYRTDTSGSSLLFKFIDQTISGIDSFEDNSEKCKLVIDLVYMVVVTSNSNKAFGTLFKRLVTSADIIKLCACALHVGYPKFALLILEKLTMTADSKETYLRLTELSSMATAIYQSLPDPDLFFGIPTDTSLQSAMKLFSYNSGSTKDLMFKNAQFDALANQERSDIIIKNLVSSLSENGLTGLADSLDSSLNSTNNAAKGYDWSWKLNQWELPFPEVINTSNEAIYGILKSMREDSDGSKTAALCQDAILWILRSKRNDGSNLLKTLGVLTAIESINLISISGLKENINNSIAGPESWFKVVSFDNFEDILLARKFAFQNMSSRIGEQNSILGVAFENMRYGRYARLHNEHQKAVNSTVFLSNIANKVKDKKIANIVSRLSLIDTASTLWSQGETAIPIRQLQECVRINVEHFASDFPLNTIHLSDAYVESFLVEWNYQARQERYETIMNTYVTPVLKFIHTVTNPKHKAEILNRVANFCFKEIQETPDEELIRIRDLLQTKKLEMDELKKFYKSSSDQSIRNNAGKAYRRLVLEYNSDKEVYDQLAKKRLLCLEISLRSYLDVLTLSDDYDHEDLDKFCALWFQMSSSDILNELVEQSIYDVPLYKIIPWINQLVSRLLSERTSFQRVLHRLVLLICTAHPWHSLTYLKSLKIHMKYDHLRTDLILSSKVKAASHLLNTLASNTEFNERILEPLEQFCDESVTLATAKYKAAKTVYLSNIKHGEFWLKVLPSFNIPLPTMNDIPVSKSLDYSSLPSIQYVDPHVTISASGVSLPKIMKIRLTDGSTHKMLLKGSSDDLRQDAIMQQVFSKVNTIFENEKETRKRFLRIRTYKIVPLGPQAGVLEFVANSIPLADILKKYHEKDSLGFNDARSMMRDVQDQSIRKRVSVYLEICKKTPPVFRQFFIDTFLDIDDWFRSREAYTRGVVSTSMVGHIMGIGDRHLNNILIDKKTGEPIHIDFGVAFDQGKLLPVPERVPFRLTRDIVDGLGCTGVEGSFRKKSEHVFRVLRSNHDKLMGILNVLRYDPLYSWVISPIRKQRVQTCNSFEEISGNDDSDVAVRTLRTVQDKLNAGGLSVEASVQELIAQATDIENLAVIYMGWTPFY